MESLIRMIVDEKFEKVINDTNTLKIEMKHLDNKLDIIIKHLEILAIKNNIQSHNKTQTHSNHLL